MPEVRTSTELPDLVELRRLHEAGHDRSTLLLRALEGCRAHLDALGGQLDSACREELEQLRDGLGLACEIAPAASEPVTGTGADGSAARLPAPTREQMSERFDVLAGLCHNINNPLTSLLGRAQILQLKPCTDPQAKKAVDVILESATRITGLVRELAGTIGQGRIDLQG